MRTEIFMPAALAIKSIPTWELLLPSIQYFRRLDTPGSTGHAEVTPIRLDGYMVTTGAVPRQELARLSPFGPLRRRSHRQWMKPSSSLQ